MELTINVSSANLKPQGIIKNNDTQKLEQRTVLDTMTNPFGQALKVTISDEGYDSYRRKVQEKSSDSMSCDEMMYQRDKVLSSNLSTDLDYDFQLGNEVSIYKNDGVYVSTKESAENLLKSYAACYNEIVSGYYNGTREIHVQDDESESGYRVLTQDEEISALNSSFYKYADDLQAKAEQEPEIQKSLEIYMKKLADIERQGGRIPSMAQEYMNAMSQEDESIPENVSEKLVNATLQFIKQYSLLNTKAIDLNSILEKIQIFG